MSFRVHVFVCGVMLLTIVNDIRNFVFGLAEATVYGFCKSREQKFVMSFTISFPHKMRSAQTPYGAWAIMKKIYLSAYCQVVHACLLL